MRKIGIYARVSTEEQARVEEGSIKNQKENLRRWVEGENYKHSGKWGEIVGEYVDDGFSGKDLQRPRVKQLLLDISKGLVDTIIMTEVSRLSRSVRDWIDLRLFFEKHSVAFITLRQNFDTSTAMGRAMLSFAIEFSQLEREQTAERVKVSSLARSNRGLWTGGSVPFGLESTDRPGHLRVNVANQIIAESIFDILISQAGYLSKTVELIIHSGFDKDSGRKWTKQLLSSWIRSRALVGEVEVNAKNKSVDQERLGENEKYKVVKAVWEPVIEKDIWQRANDLLNQNYQKLKVPQWKHHEYLLSGIVECPNGERFVGSSGWGRSNTKYVHYIHKQAAKGKCDCGFSSVPADKLEKKVLKELTNLTADPAVLEQLVIKANADHSRNKSDLAPSIQSLKKQREGIVKKLDKATDLVLNSTEEDCNLWTQKSRRLQEELDQVEHQMKSLDERHQRQPALLNRDAIWQSLKKFRDRFHEFPLAARQSFINAVLRKVKLTKEGIILSIGNPGFSLQGLKPSLLECYSGGQNLGQCKEWLLRTDSNRRPAG